MQGAENPADDDGTTAAAVSGGGEVEEAPVVGRARAAAARRGRVVAHADEHEDRLREVVESLPEHLGRATDALEVLAAEVARRHALHGVLEASLRVGETELRLAEDDLAQAKRREREVRARLDQLMRRLRLVASHGPGKAAHRARRELESRKRRGPASRLREGQAGGDGELTDLTASLTRWGQEVAARQADLRAAWREEQRLRRLFDRDLGPEVAELDPRVGDALHELLRSRVTLDELLSDLQARESRVTEDLLATWRAVAGCWSTVVELQHDTGHLAAFLDGAGTPGSRARTAVSGDRS